MTPPVPALAPLQRPSQQLFLSVSFTASGSDFKPTAGSWTRWSRSRGNAEFLCNIKPSAGPGSSQRLRLGSNQKLQLAAVGFTFRAVSAPADMETPPSEVTDSKTREQELAKAIMARCFHPSVIGPETWEGYIFSGLEIHIKESTDLYGAVLWPSAMVLCHFLETSQEEHNLTDRNVIELGAGTGLVTIVSSLLGAKVTSTDLPDVLGNLQYNVARNTKDRCKYIPLVTELIWGQDVERRFPRATHRFDYILAADVVYAHPYLDQLMDTFDHLCQENTQILWAMRFRLDPENSFVGRFQQRFHLEELYDLPSLSIKLYRAWRKDQGSRHRGEAAA